MTIDVTNLNREPIKHQDISSWIIKIRKASNQNYNLSLSLSSIPRLKTITLHATVTVDFAFGNKIENQSDDIDWIFRHSKTKHTMKNWLKSEKIEEWKNNGTNGNNSIEITIDMSYNISYKNQQTESYDFDFNNINTEAYDTQTPTISKTLSKPFKKQVHMKVNNSYNQNIRDNASNHPSEEKQKQTRMQKIVNTSFEVPPTSFINNNLYIGKTSTYHSGSEWTVTPMKMTIGNSSNNNNDNNNDSCIAIQYSREIDNRGLLVGDKNNNTHKGKFEITGMAYVCKKGDKMGEDQQDKINFHKQTVIADDLNASGFVVIAPTNTLIKNIDMNNHKLNIKIICNVCQLVETGKSNTIKNDVANNNRNKSNQTTFSSKRKQKQKRHQSYSSPHSTTTNVNNVNNSNDSSLSDDRFFNPNQHNKEDQSQIQQNKMKTKPKKTRIFIPSRRIAKTADSNTKTNTHAVTNSNVNSNNTDNSSTTRSTRTIRTRMKLNNSNDNNNNNENKNNKNGNKKSTSKSNRKQEKSKKVKQKQNTKYDQSSKYRNNKSKSNTNTSTNKYTNKGTSKHLSSSNIINRNNKRSDNNMDSEPGRKRRKLTNSNSNGNTNTNSNSNTNMVTSTSSNKSKKKINISNLKIPKINKKIPKKNNSNNIKNNSNRCERQGTLTIHLPPPILASDRNHATQVNLSNKKKKKSKTSTSKVKPIKDESCKDSNFRKHKRNDRDDDDSNDKKRIDSKLQCPLSMAASNNNHGSNYGADKSNSSKNSNRNSSSHSSKKASQCAWVYYGLFKFVIGKVWDAMLNLLYFGLIFRIFVSPACASGKLMDDNIEHNLDNEFTNFGGYFYHFNSPCVNSLSASEYQEIQIVSSTHECVNSNKYNRYDAVNINLFESWINSEFDNNFIMKIELLECNSTDSINMISMSLDDTDMNATEYDEEELIVYSTKNDCDFISLNDIKTKFESHNEVLSLASLHPERNDDLARATNVIAMIYNDPLFHDVNNKYTKLRSDLKPRILLHTRCTPRSSSTGDFCFVWMGFMLILCFCSFSFHNCNVYNTINRELQARYRLSQIIWCDLLKKQLNQQQRVKAVPEWNLRKNGKNLAERISSFSSKFDLKTLLKKWQQDAKSFPNFDDNYLTLFKEVRCLIELGVRIDIGLRLSCVDVKQKYSIGVKLKDPSSLSLSLSLSLTLPLLLSFSLSFSFPFIFCGNFTPATSDVLFTYVPTSSSTFSFLLSFFPFPLLLSLEVSQNDTKTVGYFFILFLFSVSFCAVLCKDCFAVFVYFWKDNMMQFLSTLTLVDHYKLNRIDEVLVRHDEECKKFLIAYHLHTKINFERRYNERQFNPES